MHPTRSYADARTIALTAMLVAVGAILGLLESAVVPPLPVPGIRIGLANLAVVLALTVGGRVMALRVSLLRVLIVAVATGALGGPGMLMALAGASASWATMAVLSMNTSISPIGWSVAGAAMHILAQLAVASLLTGTMTPLFLAPIGLALATICGLCIGYSARLLISRLPLEQMVMDSR